MLTPFPEKPRFVAGPRSPAVETAGGLALETEKTVGERVVALATTMCAGPDSERLTLHACGAQVAFL